VVPCCQGHLGWAAAQCHLPGLQPPAGADFMGVLHEQQQKHGLNKCKPWAKEIPNDHLYSLRK
jgi:hypothetical protein